MRQLIILIASLILVATAYPVTIHVPGDSATIQAGINGAIDGDTVLVADGTYTGDGNRDVDFGGKLILVKSENGPEFAIIDCEGSELEPHRGYIFQNGEDSTAVVEGFTIQGGYGRYDYPGTGESQGGGVLCIDSSSPTFSNCILRDNYAEKDGGGVSCYFSSPTFLSCSLDGNNSGDNGGGISCINSSPTLVGVSFVNDSSRHWGGGLYCYESSPMLEGCTFNGNSSGGYGGGICCNRASPRLERCLFQNNSAKRGGGFASLGYSSVPVISYCVFANNIATVGGWLFGGGGILMEDGAPELTNCTIVNNTAPTGAGLTCIITSATLTNCIISSNRQGEGIDGGTPVLSCCDIFGNEGGDWVGHISDQFGVNGNFSRDPLFCDTLNGNYNISLSSPCHPDSSCGLVGSNDFGCLGEMLTAFGIENESSLLNVVGHAPVFIWDYWDSLSQTAFEIAVGTDNDWAFAEMWNPAPFTTSDTFVTYGGAPLLDGDIYYVHLRLSDNSDWSSWYETSFRMNSKPTAPIILSPKDDTVTGSTPTLWVLNSFDAEGDPLTYSFGGFHDTDCFFGDTIGIVGVPEGEDSTGGQITDSLGENCIYWWSARAFDGYEYSEWSYYETFFVNGVPEPPSDPTAILPPDTSGLPVFDMLPTFIWSQSYDPDPLDTVRYKLEISIDSNFAFVFTVDSLVGTSHTLTDSLGFNTHYWWRVTAFDRTDLSSPSWNQPDFWTWTLGDVDHSHVTDIGDLTRLVDYLFITYAPIHPMKVGDVNGNCIVDIGDLTKLIDYLFLTFTPLEVGCE